MQFPQYIIFANANGGARNATTGEILKAEGVLAGVPDLTIIAKGHVFFVEMKTAKGTISDAQIAFMEKAMNLGVFCLVARSIDQFISVVKAMLCEK